MPGRRAIGVALVARTDSALSPLTLNGRVFQAPEKPMAVPPSATAVGISYDACRGTMDLIVEDESFADVPDGDMPPERIGLLSFPSPLAIAVATLDDAIRDDEGYWRAWHANFACAARDEGIDFETAQRIAARCVAVVSPTARHEASADPNG